MANISADLVKQLREKTNVGFMDCKAALEQCGGDMEKAIDWLREKGLAKAQKRAGKQASEGLIGTYIHSNGKIGVLLELNCETDFVARTPEFNALMKDLAMHVAAAAPLCVRREDVSPATLERERAIYLNQARESGKPEKVVESIVNGKLEKFYEQACLLEQPFIKDQDKTIQDLLSEAVAKLGENIAVRRFARFQVGEELKKEAA